MSRRSSHPRWDTLTAPPATGSSSPAGDSLEEWALGSRIPVDLYETAEEIVILAALPGASADEVEVTATAEAVTIRGATSSHTAGPEAARWTWYLREVPGGAFARTLDLPVEVNPRRAIATFVNGLLRLHLPKAEGARHVPVQTREGS